MEKLHPGINTIAIVGTFGCGKTTFFREFYDAHKVNEGSKISLEFIDEFAKKIFTKMEPFASTPNELWTPEYYQCAQALIIPGMLQDDLRSEKLGKKVVVESYWVNVLPYTLGTFGEGHVLTKIVRKRIEETVPHTYYLYLDHEGIPLESKNRHTDEEFRHKVAEDVRNILDEYGAGSSRISSCRSERSKKVLEILSFFDVKQKNADEKSSLL